MKKRYEAVPGDVIKGKWTGHMWRVEREIGRGANGTVYLVTGAIGQAALKFADSASVASETNTLKSLERVRGASPGPFFIEADDAEDEHHIYPFYIMEYIYGPMLHIFMRNRKKEWAFIVLIRLLDFLKPLHESSKIMGDLKPENFIVADSNHTIRAVDMGGITKQGRAVKEYTALYDRAAWQAGTRKAEPSYDLFAVAVLAVALVEKERTQEALGNIKQLMAVIDSSSVLCRAAPVLKKALSSQYTDAQTMKRELLYCFAGNKTPKRKRKQKTASKKWVVFASAFVIIFTLFLLH